MSAVLKVKFDKMKKEFAEQSSEHLSWLSHFRSESLGGLQLLNAKGIPDVISESIFLK